MVHFGQIRGHDKPRELLCQQPFSGLDLRFADKAGKSAGIVKTIPRTTSSWFVFQQPASVVFLKFADKLAGH